MGDKAGLTLPANERQIRELARLPKPELRRKAWEEAQALASDGEVASAMVTIRIIEGFGEGKLSAR